MHRDIARHLVFLVLTYLLVSAATPADWDPRAPPSPPVWQHNNRRTCRRAARPPLQPAPASQPQPGRGGSDLTQPPGARSASVTRRGRRGASARRRGCRGGRAWRRPGPDGRQQGLLIGLINVQSLLPKIAALQHDHLNRLQYDACVITETWLRSATASRLVTFPGYTLHRADRPGDAGYGGVAILIRDSYAGSVISHPTPDCADCQLESLWLRVKPATGSHFTIAAVYRPPRRAAAAVRADIYELEVQLQRVLLRYPGPLFIMGDLNCNLLDSTSNPSKDRLEEMLQSFSLHQFVTQPTYSSGSLLDVVISNSDDLVQRVRAFKCALSPHYFIRSLLRLPKCRRGPLRTRTRLLKRIDHFSFIHDLHCIDFSGVFTCPSVSDMWFYVTHRLTSLLDAHAPLKTVHIRNPSAPAVTPATLDLMAQRRGVLRREGRTPAFRELDRRVRSAIRRDSRADIEERLRAEGSGALYRAVRPLIAGKRSSTAHLPSATPDELNTYFVSVGPRVAADLASLGPPPDVPCRLPRVGACGFRVAGVTLAELRAVVYSMKRSGACGPDGICIRILLLCFETIGPVLLHIVNTCLTSCDFPDTWKHSLVHPIYKSGDPSIISNYRPISIVPIMAKIVERVVQQQLSAYMSDNHLLSSSQHGFRPRHSTETALLSVSNRILSNMDRGQVSLLCLLDLSKCFDVIPHSQLLSKLQLYGIDPAWFSSYLDGHTQSVCITSSSGNRAVSAPLPNTMGVFQGSSLGPLLFTIFANDLSLHAPDAHVTQYADDTQVLISDVKRNIPSLILRMESTLSSLAAWFHAHGLKLNTSKTEILLLGTRQNTRGLSPVSVRVGGGTVRESQHVKNLGVLFDRHLSWDAHVSDVVRKSVGLLIGLRHLSRYLPRRVLLTIVQGLIISRVRYCITVYGNGSVTNDTRLLRVINFAVRVVTGLRKFDHVSRARVDLGLQTPRQLCDVQTVVVAHRALAVGEPESLAQLFQTYADSRGGERVTRQDNDLRPPTMRTAAGQRSFAYRAATMLNAMPADVKELNHTAFKRAAKTYFS